MKSFIVIATILLAACSAQPYPVDETKEEQSEKLTMIGEAELAQLREDSARIARAEQRKAKDPMEAAPEVDELTSEASAAHPGAGKTTALARALRHHWILPYAVMRAAVSKCQTINGRSVQWHTIRSARVTD